MNSEGAMSIAKKISQKNNWLKSFSYRNHFTYWRMFSFRLVCPYDGTVPRPGALLLHFWDQLRRQDSTFVYEYGEGYHTELFWWNYLLIMQRPTRKDSFLENKCHIMPTFSCEFVLIARVQSLHGSRQLLAQDGRHWTNGWRDQSVLVNFICIYERLRHIYRI